VTWALSTVISLLLRAAGPLIRRGLPHLAMAAMAALVCGAALAAGHGLLYIALCSPAEGWPLVTVVVGLLGAVVRLAALVGLVAVVLLMPLAVTADCLSRRPGADRDEHSTTIP
jgi:pyridoxine 5'-phosphate synthase PdxJ